LSTPRDLLNAARLRLRRLTRTTSLHDSITSRSSTFASREYEQGAVPGAVHLARGNLEFSSRSPTGQERTDRRVLRRWRSLGLRHQDLQDLGYTDVVSIIGGFNSGRTRVSPGRRRASCRPISASVTSATSSSPKSARRSAATLGLQGPAARRRGTGLAGGAVPRRGRVGTIASSTWTSSTPRICSARSCTTLSASACARFDSAKMTLTDEPDVNVLTYDTRLGADNILDIIDGYDVIVDGTDNFRRVTW